MAEFTTPPLAPAHVALAPVFQVREDALTVLLWERARDPFTGAWALPGGTLVAGRYQYLCSIHPAMTGVLTSGS